ncbi:MAG: hypothetical protein ACI9JN_002356 [Bacteroidia bacterium]
MGIIPSLTIIQIMRQSKNILLFVVLFICTSNGYSQCADTSNIYSFVYNGHSYEVVKENKTWTAAAACAVNRGGYLAEIADEAEQNAIFDELTNNAGIAIASTQNQFRTASVWLGGSDAVTEGDWFWDGDNDSIGTQFWTGGLRGTPVGGLYTNWGTSPAEPDNSGGQDHLTIIIKPTAVNFGLWNDLVSTNSIYYLIEYDKNLSTRKLDLKSNVKISPNPFKNFITVDNSSAVAITTITIYNLLNQKINTIDANEIVNNQIDVSSLAKGMYILNVHFENGGLISQKVVK